MELGIVAGTTGLGYLMSANSKNEMEIQSVPDHLQPSQQNMYASTRSWDVRNDEMTRASKKFDQSKNPLETNIIPHSMNQHIFNSADTPIPYQPRTDVQSKRPTMIEEFKNIGKQPFFSQLSGEVVDTFFNENMAPFYGEHVTQNVYEGANQARLEFHTGQTEFYKPKREVEPFFLPQKNLGKSPYGYYPKTDALLNRYVASPYRTNEVPVEKVMVGPGVNHGFTSLPTGGFQHAEDQQYIMPKNIDELRVKSNPKLSYYGRIVPGQANVSKGTKMGKMYKHKPEGFYKNSPDRYFTTVGAGGERETLRPEQMLKYTNRINSVENFGNAAPATFEEQEQRPEIKPSSKFIYTGSGPRNLAAPDAWNWSSGDYGKKGIHLPPNERDVTSTRNPLGSVVSILKALTTPIQDALRKTRKQNVIQNPRQTGNMNRSAPARLTVYDPNDIARTTIKETNIHNNQTGQLSSYSKSIVYDPNDIARITTRNTMDEADKTMNMIGPRRLTVYDPNDIARTTTKETLVEDSRIGNVNVQGFDKDGGYVIQGDVMEAPTTSREMTSRDYIGVANNADDTGYLTANYDARNTNKQFTSNYEYTGDAGNTYSRPQVYSDMYSATIKEVTSMKEKISRGRPPTQNNVKISVGGDRVNIQTRKSQGDVFSSRPPLTTNVYNSLPQSETCGMTHRKVPLNNAIIANRNNSYVTSSLETNPYTMHALNGN